MLHAPPAPEHRHDPDLFLLEPPVQQHAQGSDDGAARGDHRVEHVHDVGRDGLWQLRVVLDRLERVLVPEEAEVEDGGVWEEVEGGFTESANESQNDV